MKWWPGTHFKETYCRHRSTHLKPRIYNYSKAVCSDDWVHTSPYSGEMPQFKLREFSARHWVTLTVLSPIKIVRIVVWGVKFVVIGPTVLYKEGRAWVVPSNFSEFSVDAHTGEQNTCHPIGWNSGNPLPRDETRNLYTSTLWMKQRYPYPPFWLMKQSYWVPSSPFGWNGVTPSPPTWRNSLLILPPLYETFVGGIPVSSNGVG